MTRHTFRAALAAVIAAALAAGAAGSAHARPAESEAIPTPTTATVTVEQLGAGSVVATVTRGTFDRPLHNTLTASLEVITGDGARHPVYSVSTRGNTEGWYPGDFLLADWRPELHTALLRVSRGSHGDTLVSYDVTTGAIHRVPAPLRAFTVALRPDGSGVLFTSYLTGRRAHRVASMTWDGVTTVLPARAEGPALTSTDGRTLVTTDGPRWWVTDLATRSSVAVETRGSCVPHRWLDADSVVATCGTARWSQLRAVDLDGTSTRLGVRHTERTRATGPDVFDDDDVRAVQGRAYYESYGGCGGAFLTRQTAAGRVRMVPVPGREGALTLVGARGDDLVVAHHRDECARADMRSTLDLFDPVTGRETELTRLVADESWREVLAADEVRAWIW